MVFQSILLFLECIILISMMVAWDMMHDKFLRYYTKMRYTQTMRKLIVFFTSLAIAMMILIVLFWMVATITY